MPLKVVIILCLALLVNACSSLGNPDTDTPDLFRASLAQQQAALDPDHPHAGHDPSHAIPDGVLTPVAAQQLALLASPVIQEALAGMGIADADRLQTSLLSNPGFSIKALRPEDGGPWKTEFVLTLGIIDWLTRPLRQQIADETLAQAQLHAWHQASAVLNETQHAYYRAIAAQQRAGVHAGIAEAASLNAEFARELHEAGNLSELAWLRYETAAATQQNAARRASAEANNARHALNRIIGLPVHTALNLPDALPAPLNEALDFDHLNASAIEQRPDMALIRQSVTALQWAQRLETRQRGVTQFDAGLIAEREFDGGWHPGIRAGLSLPVFDRGQARTASLDSQAEQFSARLQTAELQAQQEIADALSTLTALQAEWQQLYREDLPRFRTMLDLALREYNFMLSGTFDLLEVRQQALTMELTAVDTLQHYWLARSQLDQATGNALPQLSEQDLETPGLDQPATSEPHSHDDHGDHHNHHDHNDHGDHGDHDAHDEHGHHGHHNHAAEEHHHD